MSMGFAEGLSGKWLELLQEPVPGISAVAVIANPDNPIVRDLAKDIEALAPTRHLKIRTIEVRDPQGLERAFQQARRQAQSVVLIGDAVTLTYRQRVTALAAKHRLPVIYNVLDFVQAGGLMAYATDTEVMTRRAAEYVVKILNGAKPGDLPIEQPTRYTLAINLATAKALGITIPESLMLRADEVIR
jgi:putative ABC transport system substrate-binding protein